MSDVIDIIEHSPDAVDVQTFGVQQLRHLLDTPDTYAGSADQALVVNSTASGIAFSDLNLKYLGLNAKATSAASADSVQWVDVQGKPLVFDPSAHTHPISDVDGLTAALDSKANDAATSAALAGKADLSHGHAISDVTNLQIELDSKADDGATSAALSSLSTQVAGKADSSHGHAITDVTGLRTELDTLASSTGPHTHAITDVTGLQTSLDDKVSSATFGAGLALKLNSSSYTATDVFNKVLSLDGSGSTLNSDLLDDLHASSFIRSDAASTVNAHTRWGDTQFIEFGADADMRMYHTPNANVIQLNTSDLSVYDTDTLRFTFSRLTGDFTATGNLNASSDRRLKTNIEPIPNALNKVNELNGYTYDRVDMDSRQTGVVAQEVLKVLPEAVNKDSRGFYSVSYGNLVGLLIESIKELHEEIKELKNGD